MGEAWQPLDHWRLIPGYEVNEKRQVQFRGAFNTYPVLPESNGDVMLLSKAGVYIALSTL